MVTIDDAFDSPGRLFARADQHIKQIGISEADFSKSNPYKFSLEHDVERGDYIHKARVASDPPEDIAILVYEAVNALRSSLDHSIFASTRVLLGRNPERPERLEFPFGRDERDARRKIKRGSEANAEILDLAMSFKPYPGGDDLLNSVDQMRNIKNHRALIDCALSFAGYNLSGGKFVSSGPAPAGTFFAPTWDRSKNELTLFRTGKPQSNYKIELTTQIIFSENSPFPGEIVYRRLHAMMRKVGGILASVEAETVRIVRSRSGSV